MHFITFSTPEGNCIEFFHVKVSLYNIMSSCTLGECPSPESTIHTVHWFLEYTVVLDLSRTFLELTSDLQVHCYEENQESVSIKCLTSQMFLNFSIKPSFSVFIWLSFILNLCHSVSTEGYYYHRCQGHGIHTNTHSMDNIHRPLLHTFPGWA